MNNPETKKASSVSRIMTTLLVVYLVGLLGAMPLYNWRYAQAHGFVSWLLLGEFVATAQATAWPYFLYVATTSEPSAPAEVPESVQNFFFAMDALARANENPSSDQTPAEVIAATGALLREAVDFSLAVDRSELNAAYQGLGDHFFDDGIATATLNLQAIESYDQNKFMSGAAAWLRWTNWWNANFAGVVEGISERYDAEVR
jgi:hypothetical protein